MKIKYLPSLMPSLISMIPINEPKPIVLFWSFSPFPPNLTIQDLTLVSTKSHHPGPNPGAYWISPSRPKPWRPVSWGFKLCSEEREPASTVLEATLVIWRTAPKPREFQLTPSNVETMGQNHRSRWGMQVEPEADGTHGVRQPLTIKVSTPPRGLNASWIWVCRDPNGAPIDSMLCLKPRRYQEEDLILPSHRHITFYFSRLLLWFMLVGTPKGWVPVDSVLCLEPCFGT